MHVCVCVCVYIINTYAPTDQVKRVCDNSFGVHTQCIQVKNAQKAYIHQTFVLKLIQK